jgi:HEAT repeat protein
MLNELLQALVQSKNDAADDVLLEALRLGSEPEKTQALNALLRRKTIRGLTGVVGQCNALPQSLQNAILQNLNLFHPALREAARSPDPAIALVAMKLIAIGREGKLTYVLSECLHSATEAVAKGAVEAIVALARWVATETRRLQRGEPDPDAALYHQLLEQRPEIEQVVARAMDVHRGKYGQELLRAALLLADWPGSKTLAILQTPKHGGQTAMVRRLQQVPDSEHVDAFLLAASHGNLRSNFGIIFSHIVEPPVLDALLRKTHLLKDQQLALCVHQISRGVWWDPAGLEKDLFRRDDEDASRIAEWLAASASYDAIQDQHLEKLKIYLHNHFPGRLRLLRIALRQPKNSSTELLRAMLADPDERLVRIAARELVRRKPADYESILIQLMTTASESVRRVIGRSVGQVGFENFWQRFDRLDKHTRKSAGKAMLKIIPDGVQRLERLLRSGPVEQRIKAIQVAQELGATEQMVPVLLQICKDSNPKLRSKAVAALAEIKTVPPEALLDQILNDKDARVRANAIEVLEARHRVDFIPMLADRARSAHNRERANAIKALHRMKVGTVSTQLLNMLQDERSEHRISALWALRQTGLWNLVNEVGRLAKSDPHMRVRRYAMTLLRGVAELLEQQKPKAAG